ncbi:hypothetical protein SD70_25035 [Gordoniibacillus kamchatkensis]|uniref:Methyl-accepting chemotaxis protein n=1 Tax=Gordoniibacillus kamchatkensis TaxID=1590651 RepID=A0ABR5AC89_9BACL|nr:hypothetical protein [Paenibacillus sp. VKM B-2647]KIL38638.1 hypothetical protein SD70_25035 [Paenibacillus sp. VKM B-2647]
MLGLGKMKINARIFWLLLFCLLFSSISMFQASRIATQRIVEDFTYNYVKMNQENIESSLDVLINQANMLSVRLLSQNGIYNVVDDGTLGKDEKADKLRSLMSDMGIDDKLVGDIVIVDDNENAYNYESRTVVDRPDRSYIAEIERSKTPVWGKTKRDANGNATFCSEEGTRTFLPAKN